MRPKTPSRFLIARFLIAATVLAASATLAAGPELSPSESDGFLQALHSLEQARAGRLEAGGAEGHRLYPFDLPGWQDDATRPYRHLTISKAVGQLERRWNNRGEDSIESPLLALSHARNYMNLSEYDSAQVWFEVAADLDRERNFVREIGRERLAAALAAGDSLRISQSVANTLGAADLDGREAEVVLAFRWYLTQRDTDALDLMLRKVAERPVGDDPRVRYWRAFSLSRLGRHSEALDLVGAMIRAGGVSHGLSEGQRQWLLAAFADLHLLTGGTKSARGLYERMSDSSIPSLRRWAQYQSAGLEFMSGSYESAAGVYGLVCEDDGAALWHDHACAMAEIASELARIRKEGERYGVSAWNRP